MRTGLVLLALLVSCRKAEEPPPPPPEPVDPAVLELNWSAVSVARAGMLAEVRQTATALHHCVVAGSLGQEKRWSVDGCLANRWQLRFASPDAMSLVVLTPSPDSTDEAVGAVYRAGKRIAVLSRSSLGLEPPAARIEDGKLSWLGPGDPRTTDEGVELKHLDGTPLLIRFDAAPQAQPRPVTEGAHCSPCSFTDADGVYHVVEHEDEIPARYRQQRGRIRGIVQQAGAGRH